MNRMDKFDKDYAGDSDLENFDENESESEESDESIESSSDDESEESERNLKSKKKRKAKKPKKKVKAKIIFNVVDTKYPVVKFVGKRIFEWRLSYDPEGEWDVCWTDQAVQAEQLAKMQEY
mmetsp:Transcript_2077/g.1898  ORF Transcript_2077/g.1898 Transcript_2077/m.1898 type:complete len:121 (+) Transcript_2077:60-422(+)